MTARCGSTGWEGGTEKEMLAAFALVTGLWFQFEESFLENFELGALLVERWLTYTDSYTEPT